MQAFAAIVIGTSLSRGKKQKQAQEGLNSENKAELGLKHKTS